MQSQNFTFSVSGCRNPKKVRQLQDFIKSCSKKAFALSDKEQQLKDLQELQSQQAYSKKVQEMREKVMRLDEQFFRKQKLLEQKNIQIESLIKQIQNLKILKEQHQKLLEDYDRLCFQNQRLALQNERFEKQIDYFQAQHLDQLLQGLQEQLFSLKKQLELCKLTNQKLQKTNCHNKKQFLQNEEKYNFQIRSLKIRNQSCLQENSQLKSVNQELIDKINTFEGKEGLFAKQIQDLKVAVSSLNSKLDFQQKNLKDREQTITCLKERNISSELTWHKQHSTMLNQLQRRTLQLRKRDGNNTQLNLKLQQALALTALKDNQLDQMRSSLQKVSSENKLTVLLQNRKIFLESACNATQFQKQVQLKEQKLSRARQYQGFERQLRKEIGSIRSQTRLSKCSEIDRMEEIINQIELKFTKKRL